MDISKRFDVVIVGGGPAGMAAALWCDELGLSSCLIEKRGISGGQLSWIHNPIENYPGAYFVNGAECLERFEFSLSNRKFERYYNTEVTSLDTSNRHVVTSAGVFEGDAIIFAAGVRRRLLGVPGEAEFRGRGLLESGSRDRDRVSDRAVAVIGGGDAALENALILAQVASKVYLVHRGKNFSARKEFVKAVDGTPKIELVQGAIVECFGGGEELEFVDLRDVSGESQRLLVSRGIVRIGVVPNSGVLSGAVNLDRGGYVIVDGFGRTSEHGIYAIGDVADPVSPAIACAVGFAARSVKAIAKAKRDSE